MLVPAITLKSSPVKCDVPPTPADPKDNWPGFSRASLMSSCTVCTPSEGCTTTMFGRLANSAIGAKSLTKSKPRLGVMTGLMVLATVPCSKV